MTIARRISTGLAAAGLTGALATIATAQDPGATPTSPTGPTGAPAASPTRSPTQTARPTPSPTGTPQDLGEFEAVIKSGEAKARAEAKAQKKAKALAEARAKARARRRAEAQRHESADHGADAGKQLSRARAKAERRRKAAKRRKQEHAAAKRKQQRERRKAKRDQVVANPDWDALPASKVSAAALDGFRIPPFLLPIYQAAGVQYGVRWEVLAAINEIETDYGRNLNVSSAGALGWMQFMPASWDAWGVDANRDGVRDPYNPVDAIFAAARYLRAAGAQTDLRTAIFAYNHADWYVDDVIGRAQEFAVLPTPLVGALTGLAQGRFPVAAGTRYPAHRRSHKGLRLLTREGAPVVATTDGRVSEIGHSARLGNFVVVSDPYGNRFTYAHLGSVATTYPVPRTREYVAPEQPAADPAPERAASDTRETDRHATVRTFSQSAGGDTLLSAARGIATAGAATLPAATATPAAEDVAGLGAAVAAPRALLPDKRRLFAHPARPAARHHGGLAQLAESRYRPLPGAVLKLTKRDYRARTMHVGARVLGGTILGRSTKDLLFEIRPAGEGAPRIDPKPILDGWRLLQSTALYHRETAARRVASLGQVLLMSKADLQEQVLADPRVSIYECGRRDIRLGIIDRRVLATLEFLASSGLNPTVSTLQCGHSFLTASGNVSEHSAGSAVDISAINGIPILGHQGPGSITEQTVERLLTLQGPLEPHQVISLMPFEASPIAFALPDHYNHIHVGFHPETAFRGGTQGAPALSGGQWPQLVQRIGEIEQPRVKTRPSKYAVRVKVRRG